MFFAALQIPYGCAQMTLPQAQGYSTLSSVPSKLVHIVRRAQRSTVAPQPVEQTSFLWQVMAPQLHG
jgi:hypothetical protein